MKPRPRPPHREPPHREPPHREPPHREPPHREPPHRTPARPAPRAPETPGEAVYGLRAALAVLARRPDDILRVAWGRSAHPDVEALVRFAASRRLPCAEMPDAEIERLAEAKHHEGVCVLARPRRWRSPAELADALTRGGGTAIALDRVRNPYNIGAILRSAAFFGVDAALLGAPAPHPALPPDAVRVAEGGAEHLVLCRTTDLADTLGRLRARGVRVVGADQDAQASALGFAYGRPVVLVLGHEREGLGDRVRAHCDAVVGIRGAGAVESLNVAVAAGIMVAELARGRAAR